MIAHISRVRERRVVVPPRVGDYHCGMARILASLVIVALVGCGGVGNGTYCQSGPKYGTQCYQNTGTGDPVPTYSSPPPPESNPPPPNNVTPNTPSR